jgi:hypothetical protein
MTYEAAFVGYLTGTHRGLANWHWFVGWLAGPHLGLACGLRFSR